MQGFFNIHKSINVIHHINKLKDKIHMIISVVAEKSFWQNSTKFICDKNKALKKMGIEGNYLNIMKVILINRQQTPFSMVKMETCPLRSGTRQGCPLSLLLLLSIILEVLDMTVREEKEIK